MCCATFYVCRTTWCFLSSFSRPSCLACFVNWKLRLVIVYERNFSFVLWYLTFCRHFDYSAKLAQVFHGYCKRKFIQQEQAAAATEACDHVDGWFTGDAYNIILIFAQRPFVTRRPTLLRIKTGIYISVLYYPIYKWDERYVFFFFRLKFFFNKRKSLVQRKNKIVKWIFAVID